MDESSFSREDYILLAKMSQQTERFEDMVEYVKKFLKTDSELTPEERALVSAAYKSLVGNKRAELRVLSAIELKESKSANDDNASYSKNYKFIIEQELKDVCQELLDQLENNMIAHSKSIESKVFYLKMQGDNLRYLCEFLTDNSYHDSLEKAQKAYKEGEKLARQHLAPTHPTRLGLMLNLSVFYFEILQEPKEAIKIANTAFEDGISNIDNLNEEDYNDCRFILQLLKDNVTLWTQDVSKEE